MSKEEKVMKKTIAVLLLILMVGYLGSSFAVSTIDYSELEKCSSYTVDESGKWKFDKMIMVYDDNDTSSANAICYNFSGKKEEKTVSIPPMMFFVHSPSPDGEELQSVTLGISVTKAYKICAVDGKELTAIPLTASQEELVFDLSTCDEISVILSYSKSEFRFDMPKEEYAPIKEFCEVLLKSNALYAMEEFFALGWDSMCSVEHTFFLP